MIDPQQHIITEVTGGTHMRICVLQALSIAWGRLLADLCHLFSIVFIIDEAMTGMCLSG
jgi:hypothetical protein